MLNSISFLLIIILGALIGIKGVYEPNILVHFGFLTVTAYLLSLMMRFFRLPMVLGYILAGVIAGHKGLGFIDEKFLDSMSLIEALFTMVLVSDMVRFMLRDQTLQQFSRFFLSGILTSLGTFLLTIAFLAPLSLPLQIKIIMGLFGATLSPLMIHTYIGTNELSRSYTQIASGGYLFAIILWGVLVSLFGPENSERLRHAFMPAVICLTSIIAGFVWGYTTEIVLVPVSRVQKILSHFAIMFLIYPFCLITGLDYLFLAVGVGFYYGIISEQKESFIEQRELSSLIVFSFFGLKLGLVDAFLLGENGWVMTVFITLCVMFGRLITIKLLTIKILPTLKPFFSMAYIIPYGPLALITLTRFVPDLTTQIHQLRLYSICTTSILLIIILLSLFNLFVKVESLTGIATIPNLTSTYKSLEKRG